MSIQSVALCDICLPDEAIAGSSCAVCGKDVCDTHRAHIRLTASTRTVYSSRYVPICTACEYVIQDRGAEALAGMLKIIGDTTQAAVLDYLRKELESAS